MLYLSSNASTGGWSTFMMIAQLFFIFAVFIVVVALAIISTKWLASAKYSKGGHGNLKIIESMSIGNQSGIHLLKCGKKFALIGVSKDNMTTLLELTEDDIVMIEKEETNTKKVFDKYLNSILQKNRNRKDDDTHE